MDGGGSCERVKKLEEEICDYFYAVVLFSFLCCFIDKEAIKLGEGTDVVALVRRGFFLFFIFILFLFHRSFYYLCGSVEQREHVFSWQDYTSRIMQETYQGPNKAVVMVDRVSISITVDATIVKTTWTEQWKTQSRHRAKQQTLQMAKYRHEWSR